MKPRQPAKPSSPRKDPVQARSRLRYEKILDAAVELLVDRGVDAVAMSDIAGLAGISVASLYQYFPDKAAIVATLAERYNSVGQTCVRSHFAMVNAPEDLVPALHGMLEGYYDFFSSVPAGRAVWQASLADTRLQALDAEDMERHAMTIRDAWLRVRPDMDAAEALRLGRLLTGIVASTVRAATTMTAPEARAMLEMCKRSILTPCVERALSSPAGGL